jgi:deoxycytidylate deaminase
MKNARKKYHIKATAYDKRGRIISIGCNEYHRSHPLFKHFSQLAGESDHKIWKHAEFSAVIAAGKRKIHTVFVERYSRSGLPANAEPCPTCKIMLRAFGVRRVLYTHENGIQEMRFDDAN